jgi:RND family efflux transporter MFP subunit
MSRKFKVGITAITLIAVFTIFCSRRYCKNSVENLSPQKQPEVKSQAVPVVLAEVQIRKFSDSIRVQGNLEARNYALVSPRISGVLDKIFVREGDEVIEGQTSLFQTDSIVLEKALEIARQNLKVAHCTVQEKEANMKVTEVELKKATSDYNRYNKLIEQKVVSQDAFEDVQTNFEKQEATLRHLQTETNLELENERNAQSNLSIAEKNLKDALVIAPISGKVSSRMAEPGEMGMPGSPVLRIDDIVTLEASAFLPGQYYEGIQPGETKVRIGSAGEGPGEYPITYKSPTIDPTLRTFEIKCAVKGDNRKSVPGALVEMQVILSEKEGLGVPVKAIQQRAENKVVFIADGDVARIVSVETGIESDGWVEVTSGKLPDKTRVVVQGQFLLNDGKAIVPQKGEN